MTGKDALTRTADECLPAYGVAILRATWLQQYAAKCCGYSRFYAQGRQVAGQAQRGVAFGPLRREVQC